MKSHFKYKLLVNKGFYEADKITHLLYEVFKHRLYHLINHRKWMD